MHRSVNFGASKRTVKEHNIHTNLRFAKFIGHRPMRAKLVTIDRRAALLSGMVLALTSPPGRLAAQEAALAPAIAPAIAPASLSPAAADGTREGASTALAACEEATTAPSSPPSPRPPTRRNPSAVAMAYLQAEELRELSIAMAPAPDAASGATAQGIVDQRA